VCRATRRAAATAPLFDAGCPQHVTPVANRGVNPARRSTSSVAVTMCGRTISTTHVAKTVT
jgi:hypothetical protein